MSSTSVRCRIPIAHMPGQVRLAISFNRVDYISAPQSFQFLEDFRIDRVFPTGGAVSGGSLVHVYGGEFETNESIQCSFGSHRSDDDAVVVSPTEIICTAPVGAEIGKVDLSIWSVSRRLTGTLLNGFAYSKVAVVLMVSPSEALEKSETLFDIYGRGFIHSPMLGCDFGGIQNDTVMAKATVRAIWVSSTHINASLQRQTPRLGIFASV